AGPHRRGPLRPAVGAVRRRGPGAGRRAAACPRPRGRRGALGRRPYCGLMNAEPAATAPARERSNQERLREEIKQLILERGLQPGDLLPTESELMGLLGASRNALREAIKALQALGYVDIRHGHGTFVGALPLTPLQDFLSFRMRQSATEDLREVRNLLQLRE